MGGKGDWGESKRGEIRGFVERVKRGLDSWRKSGTEDRPRGKFRRDATRREARRQRGECNTEWKKRWMDRGMVEKPAREWRKRREVGKRKASRYFNPRVGVPARSGFNQRPLCALSLEWYSFVRVSSGLFAPTALKEELSTLPGYQLPPGNLFREPLRASFSFFSSFSVLFFSFLNHLSIVS